MPKRMVHDTEIRYEAYGTGAPIVYLQSVLGGINPGAYYFAGRLSKNFKVLLWDGPNCGQSGAAIKNTVSEYHLACAYLAGLLDMLGLSSVHLAGCSGGGEMGLLFAHLYPGRVRSLAMYRPTDTSCQIEREIVQARYFDLADAAEKSMSNAVEYSRNPPAKPFGSLSGWLADLVRKDSEKILELDHREFAETMRNWGNWMGNPLFYRANLCDADLQKIDIPVLICPCPDDYHPKRLARDLHSLLPQSTCIPACSYRSPDEIYDAPEDENPFGSYGNFVDEYEKFAEQFL